MPAKKRGHLTGSRASDTPHHMPSPSDALKCAGGGAGNGRAPVGRQISDNGEDRKPPDAEGEDARVWVRELPADE